MVEHPAPSAAVMAAASAVPIPVLEWIAGEPAFAEVAAGMLVGSLAGLSMRSPMGPFMPTVVVMTHYVLFPSKPAQNGTGKRDMVKIYLIVKIYLFENRIRFRKTAIQDRVPSQRQRRVQP